ncbi:MAG TPA: hypothetical protein PLK76_02625 [bacterium]|nr:hypothetical protein [bacterium]
MDLDIFLKLKNKTKINKIWHLVLASFFAISILLATCLCPTWHRYATALVALTAVIIIWGISSVAEK